MNHTQKFVIFGAWDLNTSGRKSMIFSEDWKFTNKGKKNSAFDQCLEHLQLIELKGYRLFTFPMIQKQKKYSDGSPGPAKIGGFSPVLQERTLTRVGSAWYADEREMHVALPEEVPQSQSFPEGATKSIRINSYERNPKARSACLMHFGYLCSVCAFDFQAVYGALGKEFIHMHHLLPIGSIKAEYEVDAINDLIPVCPNCHAMLHKAEPPLTIQQLKECMAEQTLSA